MQPTLRLRFIPESSTFGGKLDSRDGLATNKDFGEGTSRPLNHNINLADELRVLFFRLSRGWIISD